MRAGVTFKEVGTKGMRNGFNVEQWVGRKAQPELRLVISDDFHLLLKKTRPPAESKGMQIERDCEERGESLV